MRNTQLLRSKQTITSKTIWSGSSASRSQSGRERGRLPPSSARVASASPSPPTRRRDRDYGEIEHFRLLQRPERAHPAATSRLIDASSNAHVWRPPQTGQRVRFLAEDLPPRLRLAAEQRLLEFDIIYWLLPAPARSTPDGSGESSSQLEHRSRPPTARHSMRPSRGDPSEIRREASHTRSSSRSWKAATSIAPGLDRAHPGRRLHPQQILGLRRSHGKEARSGTSASQSGLCFAYTRDESVARRRSPPQAPAGTAAPISASSPPSRHRTEWPPSSRLSATMSTEAEVRQVLSIRDQVRRRRRRHAHAADQRKVVDPPSVPGVPARRKACFLPAVLILALGVENVPKPPSSRRSRTPPEPAEAAPPPTAAVIRHGHQSDHRAIRACGGASASLSWAAGPAGALTASGPL